MKTILNIALNDLQIFFTERSNLISLVVLPLAFTLVLGWAFSGGDSGPQRTRVDLLDLDKTPESATLADELRAANETLVLCPVEYDADDYCRLADEPLDQASGMARAQDETTTAFLIIPAGYGQSLSRFAPIELPFYASGNPSLPNPVEQTVLAVLQKVNSASVTAGVTGAMLDALGERTDTGPLVATFRDTLVEEVYTTAAEQIATRPALVHFSSTMGSDAATDDGFGQSVPGMGSMYVMFTVLGGIAILWRERSQWTLQRLAALPITRGQILGGKILTYFTLGMIQYLVVFAVGLFVGLDFGHYPLLLLPTMVAFVLCVTALALAVAPAINSEEQAGGIARLLSLTLAPLGGAWWPLEIVPDFMQTIGYLSPVSWAMRAFQDVMFYGGGVAEILPEISVLLGAAVLLFLIGVRRFRYV